MVKFGVVVTPFWPVSFIVNYLRLAERYGFEYGWVAEFPNTREIYSTLSLTAIKTRKIKLGTCTTNPYLRHPLVTASFIATLDEISKRRAVLGIAAGDYTTLKSLHIVREMPLKMMEESIKLIRTALSGKRFDFNGELLKVSNFQLINPPKRIIPIYIGARGPLMLKLAGKIGDGVIVDASHPIEVELSIKNVKIGLKYSKRINKDFDIATCAQVGISENEEEAKNSAKWIVALISAGSSKEVQARHGINQQDVEKIKDALLKEDFNKAYKLVNDKMIDAFSIAGSIDFCIERLTKIIEKGLTQIIISNTYTDYRKAIEKLKILGEKVIPLFKS